MTPNERLIQGTLAGDSVAFDPADAVEVDASVIRSLMLGHATGCDGECPPRVSVSGARVVGSLDLRDLQRPDGTALPSLELTNCTFSDPLELSHASIRRLSLAGSHFALLAASEARVHGTVDLTDVGPVEDGGECRVNFRGAHMSGFEATRAVLRASPRPADQRDNQTGDVRYALDLRSSHIDGDVLLQPGVQAFGGVSISRAHLTGSVWLAGAVLEAGEGVALGCQAIRTDAAMRISAGVDKDGKPGPFVARGMIDMWGARIGGALSMEGLRIEPAPLPAEDDAWRGLQLEQATIDGSIDLSVATVTGPEGDEQFATYLDGVLCLDSASINGTVDLSGSEITLGVTGGGANIDGDLAITSSASQYSPSVAGLWFDDSRISGSLNLAGHADDLAFNRAHIGKSVLLSGSADAVSLVDGSIGGDLSLGADSTTRSLRLQDARIEGNFFLRGTIGVPVTNTMAIAAYGLRVGGGIVGRDCTIHGHVGLGDAEIRRSMQISNSRIRGTLGAPRMHVEGDVELSTLLLGNLTSLKQSQIGGHLRLEDVGVLWSGRWRQPAGIDLDDIRVGSEITIDAAPAAGELETAPTGDRRRRTAGVRAMRSRDLPFYPGWRLVEALLEPELIREIGTAEAKTMNQPGVAAFLWRRPLLGAGEAVLLTGNPQRIHEFNERERSSFTLESIADAEVYLRFYASYMWSAHGGFRVVEPGDPRLKYFDGDAELIQPLSSRDTSGGSNASSYMVDGFLQYGDEVAEVSVRVAGDGTLEVLSDETRGRIGRQVDHWISPFRFSEEPDELDGGFPPSVGAPGLWRRERGRRLSRLTEGLLRILRQPATEIRLEDAQADRLDDLDGRGWNGDPLLRLDGFTYARAHSRLDRSADLLEDARRRNWLHEMRLEEQLYRCTRLRRRRPASHPDWWVVEAAAVIRTESEDGSGDHEYRRGVMTWLTTQRKRTSVAVPVTGPGARGPIIQSIGVPQLDSEEAVLDYLRLYCQAQGMERLVCDGDPAMPRETPPVVTVTLGAEGGATVTCMVFSGSAAGSCEFEIAADGEVQRTSVPAGVAARPGWRELRVGPFRMVEDDEDPHPDDFAGSPWGDAGWEELLPSGDAAALEQAGLMLRDFVPEIRGRKWLEGGLQVPAQQGQRRRGILSRLGASVRPLRSLQRLLSNRDSRAVNRLEWLRRQYADARPTRESYHSHPYEVLANALRSEGADRAARRILSEKLRTETRIESWTRRPGWKAFNYFFGVFFDFGLSTGRALLVTLGLLGVGWGATTWLNDSGMLVVDFTPSATVVVGSEMALGVAEPGQAQARVICGDNISNLVFAADYMVPILEFGQRSRCQVSGSRPPGEDAWWLSPTGWQVALVLYSIMGAIFVSITLLTVSGILRRRAES